MADRLRIGLVVAALVLPLMPSRASASTAVGGIISRDTTWTLAGNPYEVTSTVQIPAGVTLTIEPGVEVSSSLGSHEDMLLLNGTIQAVGTPAAPIVFDGGGSSNFFSPKGSSDDTFLNIDYATIRNGAAFWPPSGYEQYGHFTVRHSVFESVGSYSYVWYPVHDVFIEYNVFIDSAGFSIGQDGPNVYVRYNRFLSRPLLPDYMNFWVENWAAYAGATVVSNNSFENVGEIAVTVADDGAMSATHNYWGTTDTSVIGAMIWDQNDDITLPGTIAYSPFLSAPDPNLPPLPAPTITSFVPTSGPVGTSVKITGTNLSGASSARFNTTAATAFTVDSATQITATVPVGATTGKIAVTTLGGTATSATSFTVQHARQVALNLTTRRAKGSVSVTDGYGACASRIPVKVQRVIGGRWRTVTSGSTDGTGAYSFGAPDPGRFRAIAKRVALASGDVCLKAISPTARR